MPADGTTACGLFVHKLLSETVGYSIAAFARAMLAGDTKPGVWYPEEPQVREELSCGVLGYKSELHVVTGVSCAGA